MKRRAPLFRPENHNPETPLLSFFRKLRGVDMFEAVGARCNGAQRDVSQTMVSDSAGYDSAIASVGRLVAILEAK